MAKQMVFDDKPTWLIGSPPCTFFSAWSQGLNHKRMDPAKVERFGAKRCNISISGRIIQDPSREWAVLLA